MREQNGQIVRHRKRWYVRYWERRMQGGVLKRKRISHYIAAITTRG